MRVEGERSVWSMLEKVLRYTGSETDFSNGFFHFWLIENSLKVARPLSHQLFSIAISHLESLQNYTRSGFVQIERGAVVVNFAAARHTYGPPTFHPLIWRFNRPAEQLLSTLSFLQALVLRYPEHVKVFA